MITRIRDLYAREEEKVDPPDPAVSIELCPLEDENQEADSDPHLRCKCLIRPTKIAKKKDEIGLYLELPDVENSSSDFDLPEWWRVNEFQCPTLSLLCRKHRFRMPSTASVESMFSVTSNIIGLTRVNLDVDMVNDILILKKFYSNANLNRL